MANHTENKGKREGQQLGNYRLMRLLGRGGFAEVYLGEHIYLKNEVAVKVLHMALQDEEIKSFVNEAQNMVRLTHPHVVRVLDFAVEDDGTPFLVMQYASQGTLRQRHPKETRLPLGTVVAYVKQVAEALQHAHNQGIIHRDVKPENLLIGSQDELLLSDFGLSLLASHSHIYSTHAMTQHVAGTTIYLAPEQLQGKPRPESDQYALGVMVYEWLSGRPPFHGSFVEVATQHVLTPPPSLREQIPDLSPAVEEIIARVLDKAPERRFSSVQDFALTLERASLSSFHQRSSIEDASTHGEEQPQKSEAMWKVPTSLTSLVGREQEATVVCALLRRPETRLLTLMGTGGIGKTRLSLEVAAQMRANFPDGVCFVSLATISDPNLVIPTVAEILEIQERGVQSLFEQVKVSLQNKRLLLLLDNFEQVVAAAPQVVELLAACPGLKAIVTSRAVLHVQGEQEFSLSPLALPDSKQLTTSDVLVQYAAVTLFLQRAHAVVPTFQITQANAHTIAEICVRLDGLPLAIELAAARVRLLPPQALLARLAQRLQLLKGGPRTLPMRQQTLRNTIQWSYDLLDAQEQRLFRHLSVFVGGWTLDAAESMEGEDDNGNESTWSVLDGMASLLDKSMLLHLEQGDEEIRFFMLETIREYGQESLRESGEVETIQRAHALYYLSLAEEAEPHLKGAQQLAWLKRLEQEHDNIRAALSWLIEHKEAEPALRLSGALGRFWLIGGYLSEGRRWLEATLGLAQANEHKLARAKAFYSAGVLVSYLGDYVIAHSLVEESVVYYRELGNERGLAESLSSLGWISYQRSATTTAKTIVEESVVHAQNTGDKWVLAEALQWLGTFMFRQNDFEQARHFLKESVVLYRKQEDIRGLSHALTTLVYTEISEGKVLQATTYAQESISLARKSGSKPDIAQALIALAYAKSFENEYMSAIALTQEALVLVREMGDKRTIARALCVLGDMTLAQGNVIQAAALLEESLSLMQEWDSKLDIAVVLYVLGDIRRLQGDFIQARACHKEGLALAREVKSNVYIGWHIIGLARVAVAEAQFVQATHLFGTVETWLDVNIAMDPVQRADYERTIESVRTQLGETVFASALAEGRTMTPEQLLTAQNQSPSLESAPTPSKPILAVKSPLPPIYPDELTEREAEVLRLVAQGLTDAQIAKQLVISPRTVNSHLTSIYRKIQVSSRIAAAHYAREHNLG